MTRKNNFKEKFIMAVIAKWKQFSEEEFETIIMESQSWAQAAEKMGYSSQSGSAIATLKSVCQERGIDSSHMLGQAHNKNNFDYSRFRKDNAIKPEHMKQAIIHLRGHRCELCLNTEWQNLPIPLEVHHLDGEHLNNELENLQLLCPNCHALTENWRGKNINKTNKETISEEKFVEALQNNKSVRQALISLGLTGAGGNYDRAYDLINKYDIKHLKRS